MAITSVWEVNGPQTRSDVSDGFIKELVYRVKGMDDASGTAVERWRVTGSVSFGKPSSLPSEFIAFESVTQANALDWIKASLGSDQVTAIETDITNKINLLDNPVEKTGAPTAWA